MAGRDTHRAAVFWAVGAIVVALLAVFGVVEQALSGQLLSQLGQARGHIQEVVALRRIVRNTQLAMLERTFDASSDRGEVADGVNAALAAAELLETTEPNDPMVRELTHEVRAWSKLVRESVGQHLDAARVAALRRQLDIIDTLSGELVARSAASGAEVEQTTRQVARRRQMVAVVEVVAIAATLWLAARWWSQRERLRAEVVAGEESRLHLRQMAAGVAHEINNQLGALNNTLELLRRKLPDDELIAFQRDSLEQMEKLTREFQEFSAPALRRTEKLDVVEIAKQVVSPFGDQVTVSAPEGPVLVETDRTRLSGALLNMVKNGLEAAPPVQLDVKREPGGVRVSCRDSGPGISAEHQGRVGQPFFTTKARGTGLGIATVRQLAEAHGGSFKLKNRDGGGAEAELWLPSKPRSSPV